MSFNAGPRFFSESIPEEQRIFFSYFEVTMKIRIQKYSTKYVKAL